MAVNRHFPKLEDKAFAAWLKNRFFQVEMPEDTSIERQHAAISLVAIKTLELVTPLFLQALIVNDREKIKALLEECPQLLLVKPDKNLVIESKLTWQKFYAEDALTMAVKRKQIKMIKLLLEYYDKLEQTEAIKEAKAAALSAWVFYKIQKNAKGEDKIVIPLEYAILAQSLIDVFKEETFPNGVPGMNGIPINVALSEKTELALSSLLNILVPKKAVQLDEQIDEELLLLAIYKAHLKNFFAFDRDLDKLGTLCIRVMGLTQSALIPETGEIFCESLDDVVTAIKNGTEKEISDVAAAHRFKKGGEDLYRSSRDSRSGSGFDFSSDMFGRAWEDSSSRQTGFWTRRAFGIFMSKKQQVFRDYAAIATTTKLSPSK